MADVLKIKDGNEWKSILAIKGEQGPAGQDGLTTAISVNGTTYTQDDGLITLPDYPTNVVTTDTTQTITGEKTFNNIYVPPTNVNHIIGTSYAGLKIKAYDTTLQGEDVVIDFGDTDTRSKNDGLNIVEGWENSLGQSTRANVWLHAAQPNQDTESDVDIYFPQQDGTLALTSDIPSLTGYATETYVNNHHDSTKQDTISSSNPLFGNWVYLQNSGGVSERLPDVINYCISRCTYQTTAPTSAINDGGVHIVYLTSEPSTKYNGYIYLIKE